MSPQTERRLCCASREPAQNFEQYIDTAAGSGQYIPITLEQHWNSEHMQSVRRRMLAGETLPDAVKEDLDEYLKTARVPERFAQDFQGIRDFMNNGASTDGNMMRMKIADLDQKRNQDFAQVCPEMAELIEYVKT